MKPSALGDFFGAFADAAILFPLLALLNLKAGFAADRLFLMAGLAYLASGLLFRIPMPVQPLKSIAVAAISVGATQLEVQLSGLLLGLYCLLLLLIDIDKLARWIPPSLVQTIQFALGILLLDQASRSSSDGFGLFIGGGLVIFFILMDNRSRLPVLGIFATLMVGFSLSFSTDIIGPAPQLNWRWEIVLGLLMPQMILTLGNSVLGTARAAHTYFPEKAQHVSLKKLLLSVGVGNIFSGLLQGLPYCHGAGGLTAHVKGGARSYRMNLIIGSLLLLTGVFIWFSQGSIAFNFPGFALTALLGTVGYHHLFLARGMLKNKVRLSQLLIGAVIVLLTKNLLFVFAWAALFEIALSRRATIIKA